MGSLGSANDTTATTMVTSPSSSPPPYDQPQNEKESRALTQLHNALTSPTSPFNNNNNNNSEASSYFLSSRGTLLRYLRARNLSIPKTLKMIHKTHQWRTSYQPQTTTCPLCTTQDPHAHNMRIVGWDTQNRPVIYTCFSQANRRWEVKPNIMHVVHILESASRLIQNRDNDDNNKNHSGKWVILIDYNGFELRDNSPTMALEFVKILDHYPERMGLCLLVNAPRIFSGVWNGIKRVLDEVTVDKVQFVSCPTNDDKKKEEKRWRGDLEEKLGTEMADWLVEEIKENAMPENKYTKKYWECTIKKEEEDGNAKKKQHDARGIASFVNSEYFVSPVLPAFCKSRRLSSSFQKESQTTTNEDEDEEEEDGDDDEALIISAVERTKQTVFRSSFSLTSGTF